MNGQYGSIRDFNNLRAWALARRFWEQCDADRRISGRAGLIQDSDMAFKEALKQAAAEVDTWPQWKREALGVVKALNGAQSLPAEYSAVVDRRFWELIGDSDADRRISRRHNCAVDAGYDKG